MSKFFKTADELRNFLAVGKSYSLDGFSAQEEYSIDQYLLPWIGAEQLDAIATAYADDDLTEAQTALLAKIQAPLANFCFFHHIPFLQVLVDDSGLTRLENQNQKTAYSGQVEMLGESVLETAYNSLEILLKFLEAHEADYPLWVESEGYTLNKSNFINSAESFNMCYPIQMSRLAFKCMRPFMNEAEMFEIAPFIGKAFFDELKTAIAAKTVSEDQQFVIAIIQKAVSNFTIALAVGHGWANYTVDGVVNYQRDNTETGKKALVAAAQSVSKKITEANASGVRWRGKLVAHLKQNIDSFPVFKDDVTVNPPPAEPQKCSEHKSFFFIR